MRFLGLVVASLFRKRSRTILTLLSIATAFVLFGFLDGIRVVFTQGADTAGLNRLIVTSRISIIQPLPLAYRGRIAAVDGVERVAHANWFGGVYQDRKNFFSNIAVSPHEYLAMHPEIVLDAAAREAFFSQRTAAIVGAGLVEKFGWRIGDKIPLEATIWPQESGTTWTFDLVGVMRSRDPDRAPYDHQMLFRYDYFDEARLSGQGTAGWYIVEIADPARSTAIAGAIDRLFANSAAETKSQSEKEFNLAFARQFGDIGLIVTAIMGAVFFTLLLLTGNSMAQALRERIHELAVLKTLGFSNRLVLGLVLAESLLLLGLGGGLGLGLAALVLPRLGGGAGSQLPPLAVSLESWLIGLGVMLGIGLAVGLPPALRAMRLRIVDALGGH